MHYEKLIRTIFNKEFNKVSRENMDDAIQEYHLRILLNQDKINESKSPQAYHVMIARNVMRNYLNRDKIMGGRNERRYEPFEHYTQDNPEKQFLRKDQEHRVNVLIEAMAPQRKKVIKFMMDSEKSLVDTAKEMGYDLESFKTHVRLARKELKKEVELEDLLPGLNGVIYETEEED